MHPRLAIPHHAQIGPRQFSLAMSHVSQSQLYNTALHQLTTNLRPQSLSLLGSRIFQSHAKQSPSLPAPNSLRPTMRLTPRVPSPPSQSTLPARPFSLFRPSLSLRNMRLLNRRRLPNWDTTLLTSTRYSHSILPPSRPLSRRRCCTAYPSPCPLERSPLLTNPRKSSRSTFQESEKTRQNSKLAIVFCSGG